MKKVLAGLLLVSELAFGQGKPTEQEMDARMRALIGQRESALNVVVVLEGRIVLLEQELERLRKELDSLKKPAK